MFRLLILDEARWSKSMSVAHKILTVNNHSQFASKLAEFNSQHPLYSLSSDLPQLSHLGEVS